MPWIIGGAVLAGSLVTASSARSAANKQMDFQADMSGTAHQRQVADMRAAGLNPILSATGGKGAMTPGGAQPQHFVDPAAAARGFQEARLQREQRKLIGEQTNAARDAAFKARQEGAYADSLREGQAWQNRMLIDRYESGTFGEQLKADREAARAGATASNLERELDVQGGELFRTLRRLGVTGGTAAQILRGVTRR